MFNLEWLRTFKAIYETGTLSAAAELLFISQPGASLHLNSLESYSGAKLFERDARKMIPTDRGVVLYNYILDAMCTLEKAATFFHRNATADRPTICVGMCIETFQYTLEDHIAKLPFNLIMRFEETSQLVHDLHTGVLDLILIPKKGTITNLEYTPFAKERFVLVCGNQTATDDPGEMIKNDQRALLKNWLKDQVWYTSSPDMEHVRNFWMTNFGEYPDFRPQYVLPYIGSILHCLENGKGMAVIPGFLCEKQINEGSIRLLWEGNPYLENTLYFGKRSKSLYAEEIRLLEEILSEKWGNRLM